MPFPSNTTLLENFTGADATTPINGNWSNDFKADSGGSGWNIISNQGRGHAGGSTIWRNTGTFAAAQEAHITWATVSGGNYLGIALRLQSPGTAGVDGYTFYVTSTAAEIYRIDNSAETLLGASVAVTFVNGEQLGVEAIGSTLKLYQGTAGVFTERVSRTDSTYPSAGSIGLYMDGTVARGDDLRGGAVVGGAAFATRRSLLGVGV